MSVSVGRTKLKNALKSLNLKWDRTRREWDDPTSRAFEDDHLEGLDQQVRAAVAGMEQVADVLSRVRRDCE